MSQRPQIEVRINDATVGLWQDDARDETFRTDVYGELIRQMRGRGWSIRQDPETHRHHRILSSDHRLGARGCLRCSVRISGRVVEVEFWSVTAPQINRNGRRYDFNRMIRMHHLDRLRLELEFKRIIAWIGQIAPVKVARGDVYQMSPMERIAKNYAESWHRDEALGRPDCKYEYNRKAADGSLLEHGQTVWMPDRKGRIVRGTAYYNINNMWWVVAGGCLYNEGSHSLFLSPPENLRAKRNERQRRGRLEAELASAVRQMDFRRAETLKTILFGSSPTFMIWARDKSAYYRANYAGYTTDTVAAGRYTRAEAAAEVCRVPHELQAVDPLGNFITADAFRQEARP